MQNKQKPTSEKMKPEAKKFDKSFEKKHERKFEKKSAGPVVPAKKTEVEIAIQVKFDRALNSIRKATMFAQRNRAIKSYLRLDRRYRKTEEYQPRN